MKKPAQGKFDVRLRSAAKSTDPHFKLYASAPKKFNLPEQLADKNRIRRFVFVGVTISLLPTSTTGDRRPRHEDKFAK
jgi:hypothetical protein